MTAYPVTFDVSPPDRFARHHVLLRLLILVALGMLGISLGWLFCLLYLVLPGLAAWAIGQRGPTHYLDEDAPRIGRALHRVVAAASYLALLTDAIPAGDPSQSVRLTVRPGGAPSVGSALLRLLYSLPAALFLGILGFVGGLVWLVASVLVLITERYPSSLFELQRGVVRYLARLLAYHASLVEPYPPFALDTGAETPSPIDQAPQDHAV